MNAQLTAENSRIRGTIAIMGAVMERFFAQRRLAARRAKKRAKKRLGVAVIGGGKARMPAVMPAAMPMAPVFTIGPDFCHMMDT